MKMNKVNEEDLPFTDGLDFCEKDGLHYNPEGWYEFNLENEINYEIEFEVTHFMPLPKFP